MLIIHLFLDDSKRASNKRLQTSDGHWPESDLRPKAGFRPEADIDDSPKFGLLLGYDSDTAQGMTLCLPTRF